MIVSEDGRMVRSGSTQTEFATAVGVLLAHDDPRLAEIEAGLAEVDRGEFASPEDLARVVAAYALS